MSSLSNNKQLLGLAGWLTVSFVALAIGAAASIQARSFYSLLALPAWAPPAGLFAPVWTILFCLMGTAVWLVWREGGFARNRQPLIIFITQLFFNAIWSWLFFAWNQGLLALIDIALLWSLILATVVSFWRVRPLAGALLIPYLVWVGFAAALNYSLWQLNPQTLG
jgi:tryptophan-rich sensory protein